MLNEKSNSDLLVVFDGYITSVANIELWLGSLFCFD